MTSVSQGLLSTIAVLDLFYYGFQSDNLWIFKRYITLVTKRAHDSKSEKNYPPPPKDKQTKTYKRKKNLRTFLAI